jgi:predicted phosphohydrolase
MTTHSIAVPTRQLLWLSDIHLDQAEAKVKRRFFEKLAASRCDAVLITGDISTSNHLISDLADISRACGSGTTPVILVLGNHDFFGSSFAEVDCAVDALCKTHGNLVVLGKGEIIELSPDTALIGHRGFFDGLAGAGWRTRVGSADRYHISDFKGLDKAGYFQKLRELGVESADYFRRVLPSALVKYGTVLVASHVPPCTQALRHASTHCHWDSQPFFANRAAGNAIVGISRRFPHRRIVVHAGHSHSPITVRVCHNVEIQVAGAQPGFPAMQKIVTIG